MSSRTVFVLAALAVLLVPAFGDRKRTPREIVLGVTWTGALVQIDPRDGTAQRLGPTGIHEMNSLAKDSHGRLISIARPFFGSPKVVEIDRADGHAIALRHAYLNDVTGLAFSPDDVLYAVDTNVVSSKLYICDATPGSDVHPTLIGNLTDATGQGIAVYSIAFTSDGRLYAWSLLRGLMEVEPTTGYCTDINLDDDGTSNIQAIAFAADGSLYGFKERAYRMNTIDGSYVPVGAAFPLDVRGAEFVTAVPAH